MSVLVDVGVWLCAPRVCPCLCPCLCVFSPPFVCVCVCVCMSLLVWLCVGVVGCPCICPGFRACACACAVVCACVAMLRRHVSVRAVCHCFMAHQVFKEGIHNRMTPRPIGRHSLSIYRPTLAVSGRTEQKAQRRANTGLYQAMGLTHSLRLNGSSLQS